MFKACSLLINGLFILGWLASCSTAKPSAVATPATPAAGTHINLVIDTSKVKKGDTFQVEVKISDDTAIRGAEWKLNFNPGEMQLQTIEEGKFFKDWAGTHNGTTLVFPQPVIDNTTGKVSDMGIALMSTTGGGVTGQGTLCTYIFKALTDQITLPTASDVLLCDTAGKTSQYTGTAGPL